MSRKRIGKLKRVACGLSLGALFIAAPGAAEASMAASVGAWLMRYADDAIIWSGRYLDDVIRWGSRWFGGLGRLAKSLPDSQIDELAKLSVKEAGKALGKLKLTAEVLEDAYLRILVKQGKITVSRAEKLQRSLGGVDGFVAALRKASSVNTAQQAGHLFELSLAQRARELGFEVLSIGKKFSDPAKKGLTDLDVWLAKGGRNIYVEAKNYADVSMSSLPLFRADMDSLLKAAKGLGAQDGLKIFVIRNKPKDPNVMRLLQSAADQRGVKLVFGMAEEALGQVLP